MFSRESLELLRQRINLIDVLEPHLKLSRAGANYKALCPFHDEKTPSFVVQRGDSHYHCFGCGAHGDAIQFLMNYSQMNFAEAVQHLAEKFSVHLEETDGKNEKALPNKAKLKEALDKASQFYHFCLIKTEEGKAALEYLFKRGIDLKFVETFRIGYSPKLPYALQKFLHQERISAELMEEVGLLSNRGGKKRDFFNERIMFPIQDSFGAVIGFSARKIREETFGGKYINTPETPLFKKSKMLFGLSYSRKNIVREKKAIIVEGQIDALRLIYSGFAITVASQGTAFGQDQARELLNLGVRHVFLAFDADAAGKEGAVKIGNFFQKEGVEVTVINLPANTDPDQMLQERGPKEWERLCEESEDYLSFLVRYRSENIDLHSPAGKNQLVEMIAGQIRSWDHPLMVHESLRKLAKLTHTPESIIGVDEKQWTQVKIRHSSSVSSESVNPDRILEADLLRWLFLMGEGSKEIAALIFEHIGIEDFSVPVCRRIFQKYKELSDQKKPCDLLSLSIDLDDAEEQLFLSEMLQKRINRDRAHMGTTQAIQKILDRNWMRKREEIKEKIYSGNCSEEEVMELAKQFDMINRKRPNILEEAREE